MNPSPTLVRLANASLALLASVALTITAALVLAIMAAGQMFGGYAVLAFTLPAARPTPQRERLHAAVCRISNPVLN
jgi:hypothetical protein